MFMVAGGHFAGLVARVSKPAEDEGQLQRGKKARIIPEVEILLHKTFHRYTSESCLALTHCPRLFYLLSSAKTGRLTISE